MLRRSDLFRRGRRIYRVYLDAVKGVIERFDVLCETGNHVREQFRGLHLTLYLEAVKAIRELNGANRCIVDAACGCGYGSVLLSGLGYYVGIDRDDAALLLSRVRYPLAEFRHADLDSHDCFRGLTPDVVVSIETAEHLDRPEEFLARVAWALPYHGLFVVSVPTCLTRDFDPFHKWDWDARIWTRRLREAGFEITRTQAFSVTGSFREFAQSVPTTFRQKLGVALFNLCHPVYLFDRLWNWILRDRFRWTSTLFVCRKAVSA